MSLLSSLFGKSSPQEDIRSIVQAGATVLDVRTPEEFAGGSVPGAVNLPVQDLAARLAEVPKGKPVVVFCRSGGRSASAARLLRAEGWTVHDVGPISAFPR